MKSIYIKLTTVDDVYTLVKSLLAFDGEVDLVSGRYTVDGRSLLGIFSLDLTKPVQLIFHEDHKSGELMELLGKFVVEAPEA
ncbi:MAG: HPr family phosphocarrier protein [Ruminococcaceae bacterium]|nr:HPr family phosphocarrier protein [Oscillospiraceae bacterium]